jgi:alkanesulfonate monooxygenase SsuD/methylene tetrahydromethanopterin reductase-like flavin-dependent oxidoreductase (luciferase family)
MDEALQVLRACWRDERSISGNHYKVTAMGMEPAPRARRCRSVWPFARGLRRVGQYADGWLAALVNKERVANDADHSRARARSGAIRTRFSFDDASAPPRENDDGKERILRRSRRVAPRGDIAELDSAGCR